MRRILTIEIKREQDFQLLSRLLERLGLRWRSSKPALSEAQRADNLRIIAEGVPHHPVRLAQRLRDLSEDRQERKLPFRDHETGGS